MAEIVIRDVPDSVLQAVDAVARRQGLSRNEYLRRWLEHTARVSGSSVTVGDLERFAEAFSDLNDPDVMKQAWERPG